MWFDNIAMNDHRNKLQKRGVKRCFYRKKAKGLEKAEKKMTKIMKGEVALEEIFFPFYPRKKEEINTA